MKLQPYIPAQLPLSNLNRRLLLSLVSQAERLFDVLVESATTANNLVESRLILGLHKAVCGDPQHQLDAAFWVYGTL